MFDSVRYFFTTPKLYVNADRFDGRQFNSDPKPCKGLKKEVMNMT